MSGALEPGIWVVPAEPKMAAFAGSEARLCLDVFDPPGLAVCYTCQNNHGSVMLLKGLPPMDGSVGWCTNHWKPINSDISQIQRLLTVDTDVRETVGVE